MSRASTPLSSTARRLVALLAVAFVGLTSGCSGSTASTGKADPSVPVTSSGPATTPPGPTTPPAPVVLSPLTGLPAASAELAARPIVGVAVASGAGQSAPAGLDRADLVYVTFPLPGRQRAVALFQSQDADRVGPVDDTRPIDNKLMVVVGGVLEHAGGTKGFVSRTDSAEVPQWSAVVHPSAFSRDSAGQLFGSTAAARAATGAKPAIAGLVAFREGPDAAAPPPAPVSVAVPGQPSLGLTYDAATTTWSGLLGTLPVRAANVVVQQVTYNRLDLPNTTATEGDPDVFGAGPAFVLTAGRLLDATWNRASRTTLTSYVGADGVPVRLAPGVTVVLLVPSGTPVAH